MDTSSCLDCANECINAVLTSENHRLISENHRLISENRGLKRASEQFPTLEEFCHCAKRICSETTSGAHINTDHEVATYEPLNLPECYLPPSFCEGRTKTHRDFTQSISNEAMVNVLIHSLIQDVVHALGLSDFIDVQCNSTILDTKVD